jgi:uncharacterized protein YegJ (DUF2314 family)
MAAPRQAQPGPIPALMPTRAWARAAVLLACGSIAGCGDRTPPPAPQVVRATPEAGPAWQVLDDAVVVAVDPAAIDDELQAAMDVARSSAAAEREQWLYAPPEQKRRWAIKWAAPTADDRIEFIWVRPVTWSPHRIEGVLANSPTTELACGRTKGELVSFPIEELADWIHFRSDDFSGAFDGGFTVDALAGRFGAPGS